MEGNPWQVDFLMIELLFDNDSEGNLSYKGGYDGIRLCGYHVKTDAKNNQGHLRTQMAFMMALVWQYEIDGIIGDANRGGCKHFNSQGLANFKNGMVPNAGKRLIWAQHLYEGERQRTCATAQYMVSNDSLNRAMDQKYKEYFRKATRWCEANHANC